MQLCGQNISIYNILGGRERGSTDCLLRPVSPASQGVPASQRKARQKKTLPCLECISDSNICQWGLLLVLYSHKVNRTLNFYFPNHIFRKTASKESPSFKCKGANSSNFCIVPGLKNQWKICACIREVERLLSGTNGWASLKFHWPKIHDPPAEISYRTTPQHTGLYCDHQLIMHHLWAGILNAWLEEQWANNFRQPSTELRIMRFCSALFLNFLFPNLSF